MTHHLIHRLGVVLLGAALALGPTITASPAQSTPTSAPLYQCDDLAEHSALSDFGEALYQAGDGWFFRESDFNHLYLMSDASVTFLERLRDVLKQKGITLFLLPVPPKAVMEPEQALEATKGQDIVYDPVYAKDQFEGSLKNLTAHGIQVVDVIDYMNRHDLPTENSFFKRDIHWRPTLSRASADASAEAFARVFPAGTLGDRTYVTSLKSKSAYQPAINVLLRQLCASDVPYEQLDQYATVESDESVGSFLDDAGAPPINVVGTSFTYEVGGKFNFGGFLREASKADVALFSFSGANVNQSLYRWAYKGGADVEGTKVLLWEMPYFDRFEASVPEMDRQIIPAIEGACNADGKAIADTDYKVGDDGTFEFTVPPDAKVSGDGYYVSATISDAGQTQFALQFRYDDGRNEYVPVARPDRVGALSDLFAGLSSEFDSNLVSVTLRVAAGTKLSGNIAICRGAGTNDLSEAG